MARVKVEMAGIERITDIARKHFDSYIETRVTELEAQMVSDFRSKVTQIVREAQAAVAVNITNQVRSINPNIEMSIVFQEIEKNLTQPQEDESEI